jgi:integrase
MSTYKRGDVYWYKFMWQGQSIRESTKQGNDKVARQMESAHRTSLAKGEVGIREKKAAPTLGEFLKQDFLPFARTKHAGKKNTLRYYKQGSDMLVKSKLVGVRLDELTNQHAQQFALQHVALSASGINRGLRTLRRALNLAYEWGKSAKLVRIKLATGERQRDRVLDVTEELEKYLNVCPQPWKDCATIMADEGVRPGEVFALAWPHVLFKQDGTGLIQIAEGKSKAARRVLPMTPRVYRLLHARYEASGRPSEGWIFPSRSKCGHFNDNTAKDQHKKALDALADSVAAFVPYTLRHTSLTRLGEAAHGDVFVLAKIAGHSSITITQRYVHPQAEAINRVFAALPVCSSLGTDGSQVGTKLGTVDKLPLKENARQIQERPHRRLIAKRVTVGAGRGNRTPKGRSPADFESAASASSAIPAMRRSFSNCLISKSN